YLLVGYFSQAILRTRPGASKRVSQISGVAMIFIASGLVAEKFIF
ncbi:TPA: LysE family translocator, partial [Klebsiella pneumoniae]|nr:LysE family translocator [Klebsiella pneumoniae]HBY4078008.1 LysE family translocator [Klebsiella pneumoniae]